MPAQAELGHLAARLAAMTAMERVDLARRAGVSPRLAHRAADTAGRTNVRAFEGGAFVSLCAAVGLDPVTGKILEARPEGDRFVWPHLALCIRLTRHIHKLSQRAAASAWGVEKTAICRIERSIPVSIDPLLDICAALKRHPFQFLATGKFHEEHKLHQNEGRAA